MNTQFESKIKELEKANRILQKKLERSESNRAQLKDINLKRELMLLNVIEELQSAQQELKQAKELADAANSGGRHWSGDESGTIAKDFSTV